jgi:hypothetical protein
MYAKYQNFSFLGLNRVGFRVPGSVNSTGDAISKPGKKFTGVSTGNFFILLTGSRVPKQNLSAPKKDV